MYKRLTDIAKKDARLILGLMSGTSHDGVDAALARVSGTGDTLAAELVGYYERKYPPILKKAIAEAFDGPTSRVCSLNFELGRFFAGAGMEAMALAGIDKNALDLVGSHGQTVHHIPPGHENGGSTLQIGEPSVIAGMLDAPVVSGFRTADMADGGQGAPLTPYADWAMFRQPGATPIILNIGGISNVTSVTEDIDRVTGFDTGPGNSLLDEAALILSGGRLSYDEGGKWASSGIVLPEMLGSMLGEPYFSNKPPKSTGREMFGREMARSLIDGNPAARPEDILCTLTHLTVESVARAIENFILPGAANPGPVAVCGGGAKNGFLVRLLGDRLAALDVTDTGTLGVGPDAREALCFAILANEALLGTPANLPNVTGAFRKRVLGNICV
jgi:anhydro-N-acetylmuramic acid kinase